MAVAVVSFSYPRAGGALAPSSPHYFWRCALTILTARESKIAILIHKMGLFNSHYLSTPGVAGVSDMVDRISAYQKLHAFLLLLPTLPNMILHKSANECASELILTHCGMRKKHRLFSISAAATSQPGTILSSTEPMSASLQDWNAVHYGYSLQFSFWIF